MGILSSTQHMELNNGVRLCCFHRRSVSVELQIHIATGSIHEGKFLGCGLSHFLEHMAFQGCRDFPERSVADIVNQLGGDLNAYTGYDRTCYRIQLPKAHWKQALKMLVSMVRFPELPEERFISERDVILRERERSCDDPVRLLHEKFMRMMFPHHPLRYPVIGFKEMIPDVTREMTLEYHKMRYTPERCVVVAVGELEDAEFFAEAENVLGDWKRSNLDEPFFPDDPLPLAVRNSQIVFSDPLERLCWGVRIPGLGADELPAVELLFSMLGTGEGAILNRVLVLEKQLALSVRSFCYTVGGIGVAGIMCKAEPGKMERCRKALLAELKKVAAGEISAAHLEREKGQQFADHLRELRDPVNIAGEIAGGMIQDCNPGAGDRYLENLQNTRIDELKKVAGEYLDLSRWTCIHQHSGKHLKAKKKVENPVEINVYDSVSGSKILHVPDHQLPLCNCFMVIPGGALHEKDGNYGISRLLTAVLTAGCRKFSEKVLLRKLDEAGVEFDIAGGANSITLEFSAPRRKMEQAVSVIAAMLAEPLFEKSSVEREKSRLLEMIKERSVSPVKVAYDRAAGLLYGTHPYAFASSGKYDDIAVIDREELSAFYNRCRSTGGRILGFCGDCTSGDAEKWGEMLDTALAFSGEKLSRPEPVVFPVELQKSEVVLEREQTVVLRMIPGLESAESDKIEYFELLNQAENGLASTLFKVVREDHALSYSVGMSFSAGFQAGALSFYAMTAPGAGEKVMELLNKEIKRLGTDGLSDEEFTAAVNGMLFELGQILDSPEALLRTAVMDCYYGKDPLGILKKEKILRELTCQKFNRAMKKYFTFPAGARVLVLPAEKK